MNNEEKVSAPVKGRPKGAVDTVERKKRKDQVLMVQEGDNSKITLHNLEIMRQPKIDLDDRTQIEERIMWYFEKCVTDDVKPGVAGLCLALGISRQSWQAWGKEHVETVNTVILWNVPD